MPVLMEGPEPAGGCTHVYILGVLHACWATEEPLLLLFWGRGVYSNVLLLARSGGATETFYLLDFQTKILFFLLIFLFF